MSEVTRPPYQWQVEDQCYKVPKFHFVSNSKSVFADMFSVPSGADVAEGASDDNPIRLELLSKSDFESLLEVMYPS